MTRMESKRQKLAPLPVFLGRVARAVGLATVLVLAALAIGVMGYQHFAGLSLVDAVLESSMLLGGMGPVHELTHDSAKLFASAYALFSGLVFVGAMGIVLSPIAHRVLHAFHIEDGDS